MKKYLALCFLMVGSSWLYASKVAIAPHFKLVSVNESPAKISGDKTILDLPVGSHKLVVQYNDKFSHDGAEASVRSRDLIVAIEINQGYQYIVTSDKPDNLLDAREYANNPTYNIYRSPLGATNLEELVSESADLQRIKLLWTKLNQDEQAKFREWID
ncbi:MAG: DUF2057 family protein [Gammaproteobacteria bacterium]|nr:DUF2057 family protein [Gammaproteobacteria bacterium]